MVCVPILRSARSGWRSSLAPYNDRMQNQPGKHVVIIGCGFGGLEAAKALRGADVSITLIDRSNHHLFQPLLYQVATAGLSAPAIAAPIRHLFRRQANVTTLLGDVVAIDAKAQTITLQSPGTADALAGLGKWWFYVPVATAGGLYLIETASPRPRKPAL